jgi:NAD(P)-dependent dehydrogenase (short-subunit alcohol dehydrogenase family)
MNSFTGKHIIVTGGVKGIGKACVELMVREGAKVSVLDIDKNITENGNVTFYETDVSQAGQVEKAIAIAITRYGDIDVLVNNAGIVKYGTVTETSEEDWDRILDVNLKSFFICSRQCIPSMLKKGKGVIINVASVQAFISQQRVAAYTTSKSALLGLTRSIAVDYSPNIRCIAVCPGTVDTPMLQEALRQSANPDDVYQECIDMHLVKKLATPEDIAELVAFLASDKASFITGQAYRIDGGLGISVGGSVRN